MFVFLLWNILKNENVGNVVLINQFQVKAFRNYTFNWLKKIDIEINLDPAECLWILDIELYLLCM